MDKLKVNADKTKYNAIGSKIKLQRKIINNVQVERVDSMKYVRVVINPNLTLEMYADYLCKKLSNKTELR